LGAFDRRDNAIGGEKMVKKGYMKAATYRSEKSADKKAAELRRKGIPTKIVKGKARVREGRVLRERTVYRVWAKPSAQRG